MTTIAIPPLTPEMIEQFAAFTPKPDLRPVRITRDIKTRAGNLLIGKGTVTWANFARDEYGSPSFVSVWTADTHYAGCKSSSVNLSAIEQLDTAA
jgi:hypothetical protein